MRRVSLVYVAVALMGVVILSSAGLTQLFTQTFPAQGVLPGLTASCTAMRYDPPPTTATGSPGSVVADCSTGPSVYPLNVTSNAFYTPVFTLPSPFTGLNVTYDQAGNGGRLCGPTRYTQSSIVNGQSFQFRCLGLWYYTAIYSNIPAAGLPSFTITWNG